VLVHSLVVCFFLVGLLVLIVGFTLVPYSNVGTGFNTSFPSVLDSVLAGLPIISDLLELISDLLLLSGLVGFYFCVDYMD
jgi:hypothetical protein